MKRTNKQPKIRMMDRLFWVLLSRIWSSWRETLVIAKPDTFVRWHRKGFKLFWKFKSNTPQGGTEKSPDLFPVYRGYHNDRTHLSLGKDTPNGRQVQPRPAGKCKIFDILRIGGLHHRYEWKKAA